MAAGLTSTGQGNTYAPCPAASATVVKTTAGVVYGISIGGTGTAGTVVLEDTGTVLLTYGIPAVATAQHFNFPGGIKFLTGIKVTTTGAANTAAVFYT